MRIIVGETGLSIRPQTVSVTDLNSYSPRQIQSWLAALPRANTGEMAKQIYTRLSQSNGMKLDPSIRLKFLLALQPEIERLYNNLEQHFHHTSASLPPKQTKIAELARAMLNEQALAYKAIIEKHLKDLKVSINKKLLGSAMTYAMYYLSRLIGHCYQLYLTPPKRLWQELHTLFQLAEFNNLDRTSVSLPKPKKEASLRNIYKSSLLLALCNPNQLRTADFWSIQFDALDLSKKISLTPSISVIPIGEEYEFVVNLRSNSAPFHRSLLTENNDHNYLGISVQKLLLFLQSCLEQTDTKPKGLSKVLIRHLINALGNMATRSFSRTPCKDELEIAIGLASTHYLIKKGKERLMSPRQIAANASGMAEMSYGSSEDALSTLEGSLKDVRVLDNHDAMIQHESKNASSHGQVSRDENEDQWSKRFKPKVSINDSEALQKSYHLTSVQKSDSKPPREYQKVDATILNISPGGYCLQLDGLLPKQTQTDEIIGIFELDETGKEIWNIGIIRWIKRESSNDLQAGIQLIAPNAEPVTTSMKQHGDETSAKHSSLLLPSLPHIGQPATLLTPTLPYRKGKIVIMDDEVHFKEIKLEDLLQEGRSYSRFTFRELHTQEKKKSTPKTKPDANEDFSSLWEIL